MRYLATIHISVVFHCGIHVSQKFQTSIKITACVLIFIHSNNLYLRIVDPSLYKNIKARISRRDSTRYMLWGKAEMG